MAERLGFELLGLGGDGARCRGTGLRSRNGWDVCCCCDGGGGYLTTAFAGLNGTLS